VFLRNVDDPYVDPRRPGSDASIPADPRMAGFVAAVRTRILSALEIEQTTIIALGGVAPEWIWWSGSSRR
jgi:hypothetical protein